MTARLLWTTNIARRSYEAHISTYEDIRLPATDGLTLAARHYAGDGGPRKPVICLPGLTRNAADFTEIAAHIANSGREVIALSLRGRNTSDYAEDFRTYHPTVYRDDVLAALDGLGWSSAIFFGTSLGGIVTWLVREKAPDRVAAAIINDIGPDLAPEGIARIAGYVGGAPKGPAADLEEAAGRIRAINEVAFPKRGDDFWRKFATRTFRQTADGWVLDYDPGIGRAMIEGEPTPDLWPPFKSLAGIRSLLIHGEISDLLTPPIVDDMRTALPSMDYLAVADTGHAPALDEPEVVAAVDAFLSQADG